MCSAAPLETTGRVFDIQRFSIHDGPGIRTTVFLQGCPLQCMWCHNPEGIGFEAVLSFIPDRCIGCGACLQVCPRGAHQQVDGQHVLRRELCKACGLCASHCPARALELLGYETTVEEVMDEVVRDRPFYESSGGGITLSGGEPMAQAEFAEAMLSAAQREGLHCCMETGGLAGGAAFERVLPLVDLFLFDLKETDDRRHRMYTGVSNVPILANLRRLHAAGASIRLRLPIVPGFNDRQDHFAAVADLVRELPRLCGVEVMPYHALGLDKYRSLGRSRDATLPVDSVEPAQRDKWIAQLREMGVRVVNDSSAASSHTVAVGAPAARKESSGR